MAQQEPLSEADPVGEASSSGRPARPRELLVVALVCMLVALPFLGKAIHQDDWAYVSVAQLIGEYGVFDAQLQATHYQGHVTTAAQGILHGPVWLLLLLVATKVSGGFLLAHLISALCLVLLGVGTCSLAARLGAAPVPTALALCLAPAPLVLAGGLMTDLPMLAFFAAALALCLRGQQTGETGVLLGAGALACLAALTRFYALFAILGMFAVAPLLLRGRGWRAYLPLVTTVLGVGAFLATSVVATGQFDFLRGVDALTDSKETAGIDPMEPLLASVCALGGVGIGWWVGALCAPLAAARAALGNPLTGALLLAGGGVGVYLGFEAMGGAKTGIAGVDVVLQWTFMVVGAAAVALALVPFLDVQQLRGGLRRWLDRRGAEAWMACWLLGFLLVAAKFVPFGSTRYTLPCLPPLFLLGGVFAARHLPARVPRIVLAVSAVLGVLCAEADRRAANVYREYAEEIAVRQAPGGEWAENQTWIHGEIGFRWYLERVAGLPILPTASMAPQSGDRVLRSAICTAALDDGSEGKYRLHYKLSQRLVHDDLEVKQDSWPVRIHNPFAGAGFYGADAGYLPYAFRTVPYDRFQTWRVKGVNQFFEHASDATLETGLELVLPDGARILGRIDIKRTRVAPDEDLLHSIVFMLPGRAQWQVFVPPGAVLRARVGEDERCWSRQYGGEPVQGPGTVLRVRVDGQVAGEIEVDSRREPDHRRWRQFQVDLSRWGGKTVTVAFEADALPVPEGLDPAYAKMVLAAIAEPEIVQR